MKNEKSLSSATLEPGLSLFALYLRLRVFIKMFLQNVAYRWGRGKAFTAELQSSGQTVLNLDQQRRQHEASELTASNFSVFFSKRFVQWSPQNWLREWQHIGRIHRSRYRLAHPMSFRSMVYVCKANVISTGVFRCVFLSPNLPLEAHWFCCRDSSNRDHQVRT